MKHINSLNSTEDTNDVFWSLRGILYFITKPRLWLKPMFFSFLILAVSFSGAGFFLYYNVLSWEDSSFWAWLFELFKALGWLFCGLLFAWFIILPFVMSFAFEGIIRNVYKNYNIDIVEEKIIKSSYSSVMVIFKTLHWRFFWLFLSILSSLFFPPASFFISATAVGHILLIDSIDVALALKGKTGKERLVFYKKNKLNLISSGFLTGLAGILLSITVVGWLFWVPGVYTSSALKVKDC